MLCKKTVIPKKKYKSYSSKNCFGKISDQELVKDGLVGSLGNRADAVKYYHKTEKKWKQELKSLKNQKKIIFIMANKSVSRREIKKIKKIKTNSYRKRSYSSSGSSRVI